MNLYDAMTVTVPEGECGGMKVTRFEIRKEDIGFRARMGGRAPVPGMHTKLTGDGRFWMSDTRAEKRDHMGFLHRTRDVKAERVLVNGLGLGMVLGALLSMDHVRHIDVVEKDVRVITLVAPHYAGPRVAVHHADAYEQSKMWPKGTRWDVGWSDIWSDPSTDDLKDMARLNRTYGRRCGWHGCWHQENLRYRLQQEKRELAFFEQNDKERKDMRLGYNGWLWYDNQALCAWNRHSVNDGSPVYATASVAHAVLSSGTKVHFPEGYTLETFYTVMCLTGRHESSISVTDRQLRELAQVGRILLNDYQSFMSISQLYYIEELVRVEKENR